MNIPDLPKKLPKNPKEALKDLYAQGRGFTTLTYDQIFKRLLLDCPEFLTLLLDTLLPLPPGSITGIEYRPTEIPALGEDKSYWLDMLVKIKLSPPHAGPSSHLINIEMYHSSSLLTVPTFTSYATALYGGQTQQGPDYQFRRIKRLMKTAMYGSQAQQGPEELYADVTNVYSLAIVRQKLAYFSSSNSYHHYNLLTGSSVGPSPDAGELPGLPGPQYSIIELGKFTKSYDELATTADKLFYFMKNIDKMTMPLEQAEQYLNDGGPMSVAVAHIIKYSQEEMLKRAASKLEQEKAKLSRYLDYAKDMGETQGEAKTKLSIARKLLTTGFDHTQIAELTELSLEKIEVLAREQTRN